MHKGTTLLLIPILLMTFLTGCFDAREIDDEVYAISVGVDKGASGNLRLTIQYPTYMGPGGGDVNSSDSSDKENKKKQSSSIVHTIEAPAMLVGIDMFSTSISRRVSMMHTKWVIFSEEFAREGIGGYILGLERYNEVRPSMSIVIVRGSAEEFITENASNIGGSLSKTIELLLTQSVFTGLFPRVKFMDFHTAMVSPYKCPVALYGGINDFKQMESNEVKGRKGLVPGNVPRSGVAKRELAGMAVFHTGKMVGYLDSYETSAYLMIMGEYKSGMMSIPDKYDPNRNIVFDVHESRPTQVKAYFKDGKPVIDVGVKLESEIYAIQSNRMYERLDLSMELERQIKDYLLGSINHTIKKTQKELKADIFGFGEHMAGNFFTIEEWEAYDWLSKYPDAEINVTLNVKIRRMGSVFQSYPLTKNKE